MSLSNPGPWGLVVVGAVIAFAAWTQAEKLPVLGKVDWKQYRVSVLLAGLLVAAAGGVWGVVGSQTAGEEEAAEDRASNESSTTVVGGPAASTGFAIEGDVTIEGDLNADFGATEDSDGSQGLSSGSDFVRNLQIGRRDGGALVSALLVNDSDVPVSVERLVIGEYISAGLPDEVAGCGGPVTYDIWLDDDNATLVWSEDGDALARVDEVPRNDPDTSHNATVYYSSGTCDSSGWIELRPLIVIPPKEGITLAIAVPADFSISTAALIEREAEVSSITADSEAEGTEFGVMTFDPANLGDGTVLGEWIVSLTAFVEGRCFSSAIDRSVSPQGEIDLESTAVIAGSPSYRDVLCDFEVPPEPG